MRLRLPVLFILLTVVIDAMGIGLILPVMPGLIVEVLPGSDISRAAIWGGILSTVFAAMQFLFGPLLGNLSDKVGRKPVLLVSLVVMSLDYLVMAVAGSVWLLLIGRVVGGITAATHSTAMAYMADISKPEEKSVNFGLIGAGFGLGFVLGPVIGGLLAEMGTRAPFVAAAGLAALNACFGYFVLRESLGQEKRRPFSLPASNPLRAFRDIGLFPGLHPLLLVLFLYALAGTVYPATWAYFTTLRFDWSPGMIGASLAVYGISMAVVQALLVGPVIARIGERGTVMVGLTIEILAMVLVAFVSSGWVLMALIPITALGNLAGPALQGIMSRSVSDDRQGMLAGVQASVNAMAMALSPILMTGVFAAFSHDTAALYLPGAPYLLAAVLALGAIGLFLQRGPRAI
ncbi:TCR/Tet family MFS transporter [Mesobacterium pallidum]|uniref:TCR/Tet family MFS transporter n=1 Tax=Mesobacterium pallidum TaxID=2872037 RepID=UPI001EE34688|nr:TCR/Tet family MFS transporter [Mesobacterium pallidum]